MFILYFANKFLYKVKKLSKANNRLSICIKNTIKKLEINPRDISLKTHKVLDINGISAFSSEVNWDLRIIWDYRKNELNILDIIDIWWHSWGKKVYK